jgi:hypothetical protein
MSVGREVDEIDIWCERLVRTAGDWSGIATNHELRS